MGSPLVRYFLRGCLVVAPLAVTAYLIYLGLSFIDQLLPVGIPGLGLVLTVALITLIGFLTSSVLGRAVFEIIDRQLRHMPLVKLIYNSIQDLIGAFVGDRKSFDRPVAVTVVPGSDLKVLGFVTRDGMHVIGLPGHVAVYFPQSYNFAGSVVLVLREYVELLEAPSSEVMTFIVSGGVSGFGIGQSLVPPPPRSKT